MLDQRLARRPKVQQYGSAAFHRDPGQVDVLRLDVSVQEALGVHRPQPVEIGTKKFTAEWLCASYVFK